MSQFLFPTPKSLYLAVRKHLLTQMARSVNSTNRCQYRGLEDRRCAIGGVLPDAWYDPTMEGSTPVTLRVDFPTTMAKMWPAEMDSFASQLQSLHDINDPKDWESLLDGLAPRQGFV